MVPREGRFPNVCDANFPSRPNPLDCGVYLWEICKAVSISVCKPIGGTEPSTYWLSWCSLECIWEGEFNPCRARLHPTTQQVPERRAHHNMKHVVRSILFQETTSYSRISLFPTPLGLYSCLGEQNQSLSCLVLPGLDGSGLFLSGLWANLILVTKNPSPIAWENSPPTWHSEDFLSFLSKGCVTDMDKIKGNFSHCCETLLRIIKRIGWAEKKTEV